MTLVRAIRRLAGLSAADRRLVLRAYLWLGAVDLALRVFGFQRVVASAPAPAGRTEAVSPQAVRRARWYARRIDSAARRHVLRARCLHRSLVLHHWLRREGLPSELRIGVLKENEALKAHAWVELDGQVVNDRPGAVAPFTPLARTGRRPATCALEPCTPWSGRTIKSDMWGA